MSALDRDKAREAVHAWWLNDPGDRRPTEGSWSRLLDRLEECVQPGWAGLWALLDETYPEDLIPTQYVDADHGNGPQVVYLLRLLGRAEAKLARITALFSDDVWWRTSDHKIRRDVLEILEGGARMSASDQSDLAHATGREHSSANRAPEGIVLTLDEVRRVLAWHQDRAAFEYPDEADHALARRLGGAL